MENAVKVRWLIAAVVSWELWLSQTGNFQGRRGSFKSLGNTAIIDGSETAPTMCWRNEEKLI